jgi:hypothetical protein
MAVHSRPTLVNQQHHSGVTRPINHLNECALKEEKRDKKTPSIATGIKGVLDVIPLGLEPRAHTLKVYCSTD